MINIGAIIYQEVRKRPDLTARKFARMINVSEGHVQKIFIILQILFYLTPWLLDIYL